MKLRNKLIIGVVILWFLCILLDFIGTKLFFVNSFFIFGIIFTLFSLLVLWLLYQFVIIPIEKLETHIRDVASKNVNGKYVDFNATKDELSWMTNEIDYFLNDKLEAKLINQPYSTNSRLAKYKKTVAQLEHYDSLTSLPNRVFFNEVLSKAIRDAKRHNKLIAVLFIDIDHFSKVNENVGNQIADLVLKELAKRFSNKLRVGDVIARLGGDEFAVLLNDINHPKFVSIVAKKLLEACSQIIEVKDIKCSVSASIGISIFPTDGSTLEELEKNTDIAMHKAKIEGGGIYQYYTQEMNIIAHEHVKLESFLRQAIQNNKFVLYYQPQLSMKDGEVKTVEALIRLEHPELGLLSPSKFIPLAEEIGLILPVGAWALNEACRVCKKWHNEGYTNIVITVNISSKQFHLQDLINLVAKALNDSQLEPKYLQIEITETAVMQDVELVVEKIKKLRQMGVDVSIDDFGTGYTSINYLKQFPVSVLKIDQSFIKGLPSNQNDVAITNAIIALSHNLGLKVVAEGVESAEQMQYLADQNCDFVQGYFFSRPLPAHKVTSLFKKNGRQRQTG